MILPIRMTPNPAAKKSLDLSAAKLLYIPTALMREFKTGAVNSAGECYLHTVEVTGSNPVPPTNNDKGL